MEHQNGNASQMSNGLAFFICKFNNFAV